MGQLGTRPRYQYRRCGYQRLDHSNQLSDLCQLPHCSSCFGACSPPSDRTTKYQDRPEPDDQFKDRFAWFRGPQDRLGVLAELDDLRHRRLGLGASRGQRFSEPNGATVRHNRHQLHTLHLRHGFELRLLTNPIRRIDNVWLGGRRRIDYKYEIDPGSAVVLGVKYLHYGFGNNTLTLADNFGTGTSFAINTKQDVDTITGRISYLFSIH